MNNDPTDEGEMAETIRLPIESELDLHAFRPEEVRDVAREYLEEARRLGFREVRLIQMLLELSLVELFIVERGEVWGEATESPDKP